MAGTIPVSRDYGFLLTRTQDPGLAEELTQETFYQAVKHIGRYKGESSISTWLCAMIICEGRSTMFHWKRQTRYLWNPQSPRPSAHGTMYRY
nr:sigma factor [Enterocloster clostridioformis]